MTLMANTFNMLISLGVSPNKCDKTPKIPHVFLGLSGNKISQNETLGQHNRTVQSVLRW